MVTTNMAEHFASTFLRNVGSCDRTSQLGEHNKDKQKVVHGIKERREEECTVKLLNVFVFRSQSVAMLLCLLPSAFILLACSVESHHLGFQHLVISHFGIIVVTFTRGSDKSRLTMWLSSQMSPHSWLITFLYQFFAVS